MNVFRSFITKYKIVITTVAVLITVGAGYYLFQTKTEAEQDITDPLTPVTTGIEDVETVNSTHETTHEQTTDYQWNTNTTTTINLEGSTITSQSSGVMISGTTATISEDGSYMLSGLLDDGQIVVDTTYEDKGTIKLILNDAQITNTTTSPIYIKNAGKVIIILVDGTSNTITDSRATAADDVEDGLTAAIYSKSDLSIGGNGSLVVNGSYKDGITSKDGLIIENTNIDVKASDDGIVGKDYLVLTNTKITADVSGDGLKSSNETDAGRGYITITDSNLNIDSGSDAVQAATDITIDGGVYDFTTASGSNYLTASS
ncbi:carbohydrate-binding domain-containing protein, partial [candidate division WWE3 bacterium]|nr:carbohydrate-binding domain-containing protein [candidate division WWE3 bacterium]